MKKNKREKKIAKGIIAVSAVASIIGVNSISRNAELEITQREDILLQKQVLTFDELKEVQNVYNRKIEKEKKGSGKFKVEMKDKKILRRIKEDIRDNKKIIN